MAALIDAPTVQSKEYAWTVLDAAKGSVRQAQEIEYVFGKLVKYDHDAVVDVVDESNRRVRPQITHDLVTAASPFIYIPSHACFSHQHVWNQIRPADFRKHIANLIKDFHAGFFVDCELHAIVEMQKFALRLADLSEIERIRATVKPPNPLFSPHWKSLKDYLHKRRASQLHLREQADHGNALDSSLIEAAKATLEALDQDEASSIVEPLPLADAAVLMAADGYGSAEIVGKSGTVAHVIRTTDNVVELKLPADEAPDVIAAATYSAIERINKRRSLTHSDPVINPAFEIK